MQETPPGCRLDSNYKGLLWDRIGIEFFFICLVCQDSDERLSHFIKGDGETDNEQHILFIYL